MTIFLGEWRWRAAVHAGALAGAVVLSGCSSSSAVLPPLGQDRFADYQRQTMQWVDARRPALAQDAQGRRQEVAWNSPRQWLPAGVPRGGVLLVHGLGDSPWSFVDVGARLAADGYLVRTVLLPGHGTRPADMLDVKLADWQRVVDEQTAVLRRDVRAQSGADAPVWLGGFSTGGNLVVQQAYHDPSITGLLLFSPAFKSGIASVWLTPLLAWVRPWLTPPEDGPGARPMQNAVRYLNVPTNGFGQFYRSSQAVQAEIETGDYAKPVFMVLAEHDSVLDVRFLLKVFAQRFTHPASRLIWYGQLPDLPAARDARVLSRPDRMPEWRISQFSHMGVLFAPDNPVYGAQGSLRLCGNGQAAEVQRRCEQGEPLWYSDWGYREKSKVHARLTFNPYFDWQSGVMAGVMRAAEAPARTGAP